MASENEMENEQEQLRYDQDEGEQVHEPKRLSKPDLLMAVAFWMENSPLAESPSGFLASSSPIDDKADQQIYKKTGAVLVLPHDRALSVDFSYGGVHAAVNALNKFGHEKAKGCKVYLSRRPCSLCTKLLIQCEVAKVYYLPIAPEMDDENDVIRVDTMFLSSNCGLSVHVPKIDDFIFQDLRESPYNGPTSVEVEDHPFFNHLMTTHWSNEWVRKANRSLRWHAFDGLRRQITKDVRNLFKWIVHTTVLAVPDNIQFQKIEKNQDGDHQGIQPGTPKEDSEKKTDAEAGTLHAAVPAGTPPRRQLFTDAPGSDEWQSCARHASRLAHMLSQRSDDPKRGVGCVLMIHDQEIVAIGWNGFPAKALYGEYPRASDTDKEYYVIHAEQNALLTRNKLNLKKKSAALFINEVPCIQCLPMLKQAGVEKLFIPKINADVIDHRIDQALMAKFVCFGSKHQN